MSLSPFQNKLLAQALKMYPRPFSVQTGYTNHRDGSITRFGGASLRVAKSLEKRNRIKFVTTTRNIHYPAAGVSVHTTDHYYLLVVKGD